MVQYNAQLFSKVLLCWYPVITVSMSFRRDCQPRKRQDQCYFLGCGQSGPAFAQVDLRLIVDNRSSLRSCNDCRLSVLNPKECMPTSIHRLSELKVLIIHIYTPFPSARCERLHVLQDTHISIRITR